MGWAFRIYILTDPNGSKFHRSEELPAVFPSYTITQTAQGGDCDTQFLTPMPPGEFIHVARRPPVHGQVCTARSTSARPCVRTTQRMGSTLDSLLHISFIGQ